MYLHIPIRFQIGIGTQHLHLLLVVKGVLSNAAALQIRPCYSTEPRVKNDNSFSMQKTVYLDFKEEY